MSAGGARALVLGGTGYLGREVVGRLARAGLAVSFTYHRAAAPAAALAREHGAAAYPLELADSAAVTELMARVCRERGVPDVLVSCAGHADASALLAIDDDGWDRVMEVNVRGVFVACRELGRAMVERGRGDIVLCVGPDALGATPSAVHFAASQAALAALVRAAAAELGPRGVRVNAVAVVLDGGAGGLLSDERRADVERYSALGRLGRAEEAARAIAWVALENPYLNGAIIPVTGGL